MKILKIYLSHLNEKKNERNKNSLHECVHLERKQEEENMLYLTGI